MFYHNTPPEHHLSVVRRFVDEIATLPDERIFDAVLWVMSRMKLVTEDAAASTVGALLDELVPGSPGARVVCILSGGNLDVEKLRGMKLTCPVKNRVSVVSMTGNNTRLIVCRIHKLL